MLSTFKFRTALLLLLCSSTLLFASAEDTTSTDSATDTETQTQDYVCANGLLDDGATLVTIYEDFLNEYFQVDTPSSDQFEYALKEYRFIELALNTSYKQNLELAIGSASKQNLSTASSELQYCDYVLSSYQDYIKTLFQRQMLGSTVSKVTFKVVDGLKVMNQDLDALSETFGTTFPGLFTKMNNDLPCYARSCASK